MNEHITLAIKQRVQNLEDHKPDSAEQYKAAFRQAIDDINALLNILDELTCDDYGIEIPSPPFYWGVRIDEK